jgi:hypothetical protein
MMDGWDSKVTRVRNDVLEKNVMRFLSRNNQKKRPRNQIKSLACCVKKSRVRNDLWRMRFLSRQKGQESWSILNGMIYFFKNRDFVLLFSSTMLKK